MNMLTGSVYAMSMQLLNIMLRSRDASAQGRGRAVLVTSARPGEGKTFVSRMIASCMADLSNDPVLLVDGNLERPALHREFGIANAAGFTDCLASGELDRVQPDAAALQNLFVMTAGGMLRPGLLFKPQAFDDFLSHFRSRYGLVLIDGGSLATMGCLPHHSDGTVMVIDSNRTRREVVQGVMNQAKVDHNRYLGAVLNKRVQYIPRALYRYF